MTMVTSDGSCRWSEAIELVGRAAREAGAVDTEPPSGAAAELRIGRTLAAFAEGDGRRS